MKYQKSLLAITAILNFTSANTQAALTSYNANGVDLVYSSVSKSTWTKDANLLGTLESSLGFNTVVNAIIAASPVINDTPNIYDTPISSGHHSVTNADFDSSLLGSASWFGAIAFTNYLNSISYAGSNQWNLPSAGASPLVGTNRTGTQFGDLFYTELGGNAYVTMPNTDNFTNEQDDTYWLGTEYAPNLKGAWTFVTHYGLESATTKDVPYYAWAVSPGQVAAVPVPSAIWLFGSALIGFIGCKRRCNLGK
jgi:hypothetical protein